jgi:hypothetical protein
MTMNNKQKAVRFSLDDLNRCPQVYGYFRSAQSHRKRHSPLDTTTPRDDVSQYLTIDVMAACCSVPISMLHGHHCDWQSVPSFGILPHGPILVHILLLEVFKPFFNRNRTT